MALSWNIFSKKKPPRGDSIKKKKPDQMVFEEVPDTNEEMVFEEVEASPAEKAVTKILGLEGKIGNEKKDGASKERIAVLEVQLAQAKYEQARLNEQAGRGQEGAADQLLEAWQGAQDSLEDFRGLGIKEALEEARSRADYLSADDAAQMRRHQ